MPSFGDLPGAVFLEAAHADADAIHALTRAVYAKYVPQMGREPLTMSADQAAAIRDHQVWVLEAAGALIASLELIAEPDCLVVENVAVAEVHQGQGLGRRLMAFAEDEARRQGFVALRLYTNEHMAGNVGLYGALDYHETGRVLYEGTYVVHMRKNLKDVLRP